MQNPSNATAISKRKSFGFPAKHNPSEREIHHPESIIDTSRFSPTPLSNHSKVSNGLYRSKSVSNRYSLPASKVANRPTPLPRISSPPLSSSASDVSTSSTASCLSSKGPAMFKPPSRPISPCQLQVGDRIQVDSMGILGTLRFIGSTKFKPGIWAGIELDQQGTGKNDGIVDGHCTPISESASELSEDCLPTDKTVKRASVPASLYKSNSARMSTTQKRASFGFQGHRSAHTYGASPSHSISSASPSPSPTPSIKAPPTPSRSSTPIKGMQLDNLSRNRTESRNQQSENDADTETDTPHKLQLKLEILEAENEFLKLEVKQTKSNSEIGILKTEIETLRRQKQEWEREKESNGQLVELLESEMNGLKAQFSDLKLNEQPSGTDSTSENPPDATQAGVNKLVSTIQDVKAALKIRSALEMDLRDRISRLETSSNADSSRDELVKTLQAELEERSIEVGKLTARLDRVKSDFEKEKSQLIESFKNRESADQSTYGVTTDEESTSSLLKKIQQHEMTIKSQERLLRDFKAAGAEAFDHYEKTLQSIKKENLSLKEQAENVVSVCRQLESDADTLRLELEKAKAREEELTRESSSLQEAVNNYQLSNVKRKEEIQKLKLELQRQNNEILNLTEKQRSGMEGLSFNDEKDRLLSQIDELMSSVNSLEAEKSNIVKAHEELLESHDKTKSEMINIRNLFEQFDAERHTWAEQRVNLQQKLDAFREMVEAKDRELQDHKDELAQLNVFIEEKNSEMSTLKSKIAELESQNPAETETSRNPAMDADYAAEISQLRKRLEELEEEHSATLEENVKLQEEHAELTEAQEKLLEMHTHMETECLKLMEEVEKLHSESLENPDIANSDISPPDVIEHDSQESADFQTTLHEKDRAIAEVKQQYRAEIREMQKKITELELSKQHELDKQAKDIAELESLVESKIFRETELEEQISDLKQRIARLEAKLENAQSNGSSSQSKEDTKAPSFDDEFGRLDLDVSYSEAAYPPTDEELFCELCDSKGHDILSCTAFSLTGQDYSHQEIEDEMFCENCEEYGAHWTDDCPNQDEALKQT
ncbi:hypothetical protein K493DRAFT_307011 [Basidiobolus meristosporus CBS 931.73]|uniref:CAP-Gly domain-containing protein n=1 Tax=Basidiobolus meristosporus CBS 931.73 TaxID=1314790 RepID=A0A1Y1XMQ7_9FUNG|nr:hypothetical protein K493DRAFT_307011 [Basidiobolus meristosporus CBS 931.73]|eukprot:ORX86796.1 hypothetical protein K493DRAFT_307011 [Basidiobolus meristosporus CBS 931.73]